ADVLRRLDKSRWLAACAGENGFLIADAGRTHFRKRATIRSGKAIRSGIVRMQAAPAEIRGIVLLLHGGGERVLPGACAEVAARIAHLQQFEALREERENLVVGYFVHAKRSARACFQQAVTIDGIAGQLLPLSR